MYVPNERARMHIVNITCTEMTASLQATTGQRLPF